MQFLSIAALLIGVCGPVCVQSARPDNRLPRSESPIVIPPNYENLVDSSWEHRHVAQTSPVAGYEPDIPVLLQLYCYSELSFTDAFQATYTYTIPYTATYLPDGPLSYPVHLWVNDDNEMVRLDTYNSLDSELHRDGAVYFRMPRIDECAPLKNSASWGECFRGCGGSHKEWRPLAKTHIMCWYSCQWWRTGQKSLHAPHHHTAAHFLSAISQKPSTATTLKEGGGLPDFEEWKFDKELVYNGVAAERWTYKVKVEEKVSHYAVIVSKKDGLPLYLHMMGSEIVANAHFDEYVMNFTSFKAVPSNSLSAFEVPSECEDEKALESMPSRPLSLALASLVPGAEVGHTEYSDFREKHGQGSEDTPTHKKRAHTFLHHSAAVKQHNLQKDRRFTMELNRFADWSHDEFSGGMLGFKRSDDTRAAIAAVQSGEPSPVGSGKRSKFQHTPGFVATPGSVDWRGSGAVGPVKDQGVCGSCWTFSASQAVSSAHWMQTGEYVSLSEQQMLDCAWNYDYNSACNGGDPDLAVQYSIDTGGSFSEKDYPYKGVDDFCKVDSMADSDASRAVVPAEVVYIESRNIEAVKEALAKHGPVSVGIDATPIPFRFYSNGVLDTAECSSAVEAIDHAVLLVGYGEEDGVPYWILKNEWSAHWGDEGFIKVAQEYDCGIATEAFFVIVNATMT